MSTILIVANETLGGCQPARGRAGEVPAPRTKKAWSCASRATGRAEGFVIYDDAVYDAAQVRIDLARQFLRERWRHRGRRRGQPRPVHRHDGRGGGVCARTRSSSRRSRPRRRGGCAATSSSAIAGGDGPARHARRHRPRRRGPPFDVTLVVANRTRRAAADRAPPGQKGAGDRSACSSSSCPRRAAAASGTRPRAGASARCSTACAPRACSARA